MKHAFGLWAVVLLLLCARAVPARQAAQKADDKAVNVLIESLLTAQTDAERTTLLNANSGVDHTRWTQALISRLEGFWAQRRFAQTLSLLDFAHRQAAAAGNRHEANLIHIEMARAHYAQEEYPAAEAIFQDCLQAFEAEPNPEGMVRSLFGIAESYAAREQDEQAAPYYLRAIKVAQRAPLPFWYAFLSNWVGERCRVQGDLAQAQAYYEQCLPAARQAGVPWLVALALNNLGLAQIDQGDLAHALTSLHQSLALRQMLKDDRYIADTLDNLGTLCLRQNDFPLALDYYHQGLQLRRKTNDRAKIPMSLNNVALAYTHLNNWDEALRNYHESQALLETSKDERGLALIAENVAYLYHCKGDLERTEGKVTEEKDDLARAMAAYQKVLSQYEAWDDKPSSAQIEIQMADVSYLQGNYAAALNSARRAIALAEQQGSLGKLKVGWSIIGRVCIATKQYDQAQQALERAMAISEQLRAQAAGGEAGQQQFFGLNVSPFQQMAVLRVLQGRPTEALTCVERMKARTLLDVLQRGRVSIIHSMTPEERERERQHNTTYTAVNTALTREQQRPHPDPARLTDLRKRRDQALRDYDAFRFSLYAAHPDLQARRGEARIITPEEIRAFLPDAKSAVVAFLSDYYRTYLFTVTRGAAAASPLDVQIHAIPITRHELEQHVEAFRKRVSDPNRAVSQEAGELYRLLLQPAERQLEGKTTLILVPDGPLWDLPFQALQPRKGHYLLQDAILCYAPSLTALREMHALLRRRSAAGEMSLLAFGNPALGEPAGQRLKTATLGGRVVSLPEAEREVRTLEQIYSPQHSRIYIGAEAQKARALASAGDYRILHFATHAILDNTSPLYSYIALSQSGDKADDGLLTAREIMDLDLKADLAVLSACETARGDLESSEGVVGLSWALFIAGCPIAVASQWEVDSASTTELMLAFHRARHAGKPTAAALREAELSRLKRTGREHPFYWAGFVTIGAGDMR